VLNFILYVNFLRMNKFKVHFIEHVSFYVLYRVKIFDIFSSLKLDIDG